MTATSIFILALFAVVYSSHGHTHIGDNNHVSPSIALPPQSAPPPTAGGHTHIRDNNHISPSIALPPQSAPPPTAGGELPLSPSPTTISSSPTSSPPETPPIVPKEGIASPPKESEIPFLSDSSSSNAVPLPTSNTTAVVGSVPTTGDANQAGKMGPASIGNQIMGLSVLVMICTAFGVNN